MAIFVSMRETVGEVQIHENVTRSTEFGSDLSNLSADKYRNSFDFVILVV